MSDRKEIVRPLEEIAAVLAGLADQRAEDPDQFYGALCAAACRLTSLRRAVLFRWDGTRRRVRPAGAFDVDTDVFAGDLVDVDVLPAARLALDRDEVVESRDHPVVSDRYGALINDRTLVVTPMVVGYQKIGVMVGDRLPDAPALGDDERYLLWSLGKTAALAATARTTTEVELRARDLESRLGLARDMHDGAIQRLFGVSLVLSGEGPLDHESRARASEELQLALGELRETLQRPLAPRARVTSATFGEELQRLSQEYAGASAVRADGSVVEVPAHLEPVAQSVLVEAVRNAHKHADPSQVVVSVRRDAGTFVLDVVNDGARVDAPRGGGMGLRLAGLEVLQLGGVLEYGPAPGSSWKVTLTVPDDA